MICLESCFASKIHYVQGHLICPSAQVTIDELRTQLTYQMYYDHWLLCTYIIGAYLFLQNENGTDLPVHSMEE